MAKRRLTTTISIVIDDQLLEATVTGNYNPYRPSNDYYSPPDEAEFEIDIVVVDGVDITNRLDAKGYDFADIEELCLNAIEE
jgi:hypothetical protein